MEGRAVRAGAKALRQALRAGRGSEGCGHGLRLREASGCWGRVCGLWEGTEEGDLRAMSVGWEPESENG